MTRQANPSLVEQFEIVPPRADAMVESMRSFGYTLEAAVADLVDNSIFAGARSIWIDFHWGAKDSTIVLKDDGRGLNETALLPKVIERPGSSWLAQAAAWR